VNKVRPLFRAICDEGPVTVALATDDDLRTIAGLVECAEDALEHWLMVAVRLGTTTTIHVLGWRVLGASICITPAIVAFDRALGAVRSAAGNGYSLGVPGKSELDPDLRVLLVDSMRNWGFTRIRSQPASGAARRHSEARQRRRGKHGSTKQDK
jgi:hypothetical protein